MNAIWAKNIRSQMNHTLAFRYNCKARGELDLHICAASLYRVFVDGNFIGYGPARCAHGYSRLDKYTLPMSDADRVIVVEVFASNINTYYIVDEPPFFAAELFEDGKMIAESPDFEAYLATDRKQKVQRYSYQRAFTESYRMSACRQNFYKGLSHTFEKVECESVSMNLVLDRIVSYPTFENVLAGESVGGGVVTIDEGRPRMDDRATTGISNVYKGYRFDELEECLSHEVSLFDLSDPFAEKVSKDKNIRENEYKMFAYERTLSGFASMKLEALCDSVVYLIFDEVLSNENGKKTVNFFRDRITNAVKFELKAGKYELLTFESYTMRYACVIVTKGEIVLDELSIKLYENPDVSAYDKSTGDSELDEVISAARACLAQNSVDVLTDCPSRERAGWLCDSYYSSRAEYFFTGKNLVEKSFLEAYLLSPQLKELDEGMLPMCYPADHTNGTYIPNWTMWFMLELENYINRTGDTEIIPLAKKRVYALIGAFDRFVNSDGLLEDLESWVFVEWSKCNDKSHTKGVNYPSNILFAAALASAGRMFDDEKLIERAENMRATIRAQAFNGEFFDDNAIRVDGKLKLCNNITETCQYYAFAFDCASKEDYPKLYNMMLEVFGPERDAAKVYPEVCPSNALPGNTMRFDLLLREKKYERLIREIKTYYLPMARLTGTLWEHNGASCSLNHAFSSVSAMFINEALKGLKG